MNRSLSVSAFRFIALVLTTSTIFVACPRAEAKAPKMRDIADTVDTNVITTKFAQILQASDLGTFLSSRGPFTVFVPTDSAFSKLPPGTIETLMRPENLDRLKAIVLFHIVNNKRLSGKDLLLLKTIPSCLGPPLTFKTSHTGTQFVMKAKITHADIRCANGTINQIDTLLMPPEASLPPLTAPAPAVTQTPASTNTITINEEVSPVPGTNGPTAVSTNAVQTVPVAPAVTPAH